MRPLRARVTMGLQVGSYIDTCDNSGAKLVKITSVFGSKTVKGRVPSCGVGHLVTVAVKEGKQDMRKQVVLAVIARQKKEYRRADGMRLKFEDNACIIVKDEKGNPKGTMVKGPIAREVCDRWLPLAKLATIVV